MRSNYRTTVPFYKKDLVGEQWSCCFFRVDLEDADDDEDDKCSLTVALMQTKRRKLKAEEGKPMLTIGFSIYKVSFTFVYQYSIH